MDGVELRILGSVQVLVDGRPLPLGRRAQRLLLGVLLLEVGRPVPAGRLIELLWGADPPRHPRKTVQLYVARLRQSLAALDSQVQVGTEGGGYVLRADPEVVDARRFAGLVERAGLAADPAQRRDLLAVALDLWRGPPLADAASDEVRRQVCSGLEEARLAALELRVDADLALGRHRHLIPELTELIAAHPLRERLCCQYLLALFRSGRRPDALRVFQEVRNRLVVQFGVEPGAELTELHQRILNADPTLTTTEPGEEPTSPPIERPGTADPVTAYRQLPADISEFTGRQPQLQTLLAAASDTSDTGVAIWTITGMGGVGKTRLAIHAAHSLVLRDRYPDGQLYVDLAGYTADATPADPHAVLDSYLRLLGVPGEQIPPDLDSRARLYRDRLAGKQILLLLDNAASEAQVRPLIPASPDSLVLVTSRHNLVLDGARSIDLDVFTADESIDLLRAVAGAQRVDAEPDAARNLAHHCGHLPLAVALAARRLATRPSWRIAHLATRLADQQHRLAELAAGDRTVDAAITLSYEALDHDLQRCYRLLGIHPGEDFTALSASALTGADPDRAEHALEFLLDEHLLLQTTPGRYRLHDLVRAHAAAQCRAEDSTDERRAAITRLLDWYQHSAGIASPLVRNMPIRTFGPMPVPATPGPLLNGRDDALAWLDAEHASLLAAVRHAAAGGWHAHALQLPNLLWPYFLVRGAADSWIAAHHLALAAASHLDDTIAQAHTLTWLSYAYQITGRLDEALAHLRRASDMHEQLDDPHGAASTAGLLGTVCTRLGRYAEAAQHHRAALHQFRQLGDRHREANTRCRLGETLYLAGQHAEAIENLRQALALQPGMELEAGIRHNLGCVHTRLGQYAEGQEHLQYAVALHRQLGDRLGEAGAYAELGISQAHLGQPAQALQTINNALTLARQLGYREAETSALNSQGEVHHMTGNQHASLRAHRDALAIAEDINNADEQARAHAGITAAAHATSPNGEQLAGLHERD